VTVSGPGLAAGAAIPPAELEAFIDGVVRQGMQEEHIPGVAVSVVQNGQILLKKGYGSAAFTPGRAVDPDNTLFRLGDLSAAFTWLAVLKEVERSHMRLDAPINLYLPEKLQVRDEGYAEPVRLRDLMDHASGFEERALGRLYERDPERVRALDVYLRQERPRRVLAPGMRAEFSDYDAALAGEALSQAPLGPGPHHLS
jgi:CubicO group peptidase (beta-lactamase class C family)